MKKIKKKLELSREEAEDLWSSVEMWLLYLDKKENPITAKALKKLNNKLRLFVTRTKWI